MDLQKYLSSKILGATMVELKNWQSSELNQKYDYTCVPAGYEWLLLGIKDFQKEFDLGDHNGFASVRSAITVKFLSRSDKMADFIKRVQVKSYPTTKDGWEERLVQIKQLLKKDIACIMPVPVKNDWHIMPVIKLEDDKIWMLRENYAGLQRIDILKLKPLRRYFLNEEGGEDLAWLEPDVSHQPKPKKKLQRKK
jgi:hypothetical protein